MRKFHSAAITAAIFALFNDWLVPFPRNIYGRLVPINAKSNNL
jgi:hypothetical protein